MQFFHFKAQSIAALLALLAATSHAQSCTVRPRQEFRDLTSTQWQSFVRSVKALQRSGEYDRLAQLHVQHQRTIHNGPNFLPWHRYYTLQLEQGLQQTDSSVMLPYWNWAIDSQAPERSLIFTDAYLGGNGQGRNRCVRDGQFSDWRPAGSSERCVTRQWDRNERISSFYSVDVINRIVSNVRSYDTFRNELERAPHGAVHINVGGAFATMSAPNDPLFFLHHAYVDKIWADWQLAHPEAADSYGGTNRDGSAARLSDALVSSRYTVRDMMSTRALCYEYAALVNVAGTPPPGTVIGTPSTPTVPEDEDDEEDDEDDAPVPGETPAQRRQRRQERRQRRRQRREQRGLTRRSMPAYAGRHDATRNGFTGGFTLASAAKTPDCQEPSVVVTDYTGNSTTRRVSATDRSDLLAIRTPFPLPLSWINMHGFNVTEFRAHEGAFSRLCTALNSVAGYASPAALIHRQDMLEGLASKPDSRFYAIAGGKNTTLTGYHTADSISSALEMPVQAPELYRAVERVIGRIVYPEVATYLPTQCQE